MIGRIVSHRLGSRMCSTKSMQCANGVSPFWNSHHRNCHLRTERCSSCIQIKLIKCTGSTQHGTHTHTQWNTGAIHLHNSKHSNQNRTFKLKASISFAWKSMRCGPFTFSPFERSSLYYWLVCCNMFSFLCVVRSLLFHVSIKIVGVFFSSFSQSPRTSTRNDELK